MKFKIVIGILIVFMLGLFSFAIYQAYALKKTNNALEIAKEDLVTEKKKLEDVLEENKALELAKLEAENEDELWDYAQKTATLEAYTNYIKIKGYQKHETVLNKKIDEHLSKKTGYIQFVESNGTMLLTPYKGIDNRKDLWIPKSAMSVRRGVIGNSNFRNTSRTGNVILEGQIVKMLGDYIPSGNAKWAKISYGD